MSDADGVIVWVNQQIEREFGYTRDQIVGKPVEILVPDGLGHDRSSRARRRDGSEFAVDIAINPFETAEGLFVTAVDPCVGADVRVR